MSSQEPANNAASSPPVEMAALENFIRLQQSQKEYLVWLEANEKKAVLDGYVYRQIR